MSGRKDLFSIYSLNNLGLIDFIIHSFVFSRKRIVYNYRTILGDDLGSYSNTPLTHVHLTVFTPNYDY